MVAPQYGAPAGSTGNPNPPGVPSPRKAGPVAGWSTEHAAGAIALAALGTLVLVRRGFRGVTVKLGS